MKNATVIILLALFISCKHEEHVLKDLIFPNVIEVSFEPNTQVKVMIPILNPNTDSAKIVKTAVSCNCLILEDSLDGKALLPNDLFYFSVLVNKKDDENKRIEENIVIRTEGLKKNFYPITIKEGKKNTSEQ